MTKNATYYDKHVSSWKCIFFVVVGDVSTGPSLNLCLSSSNSVDKLKVIKKDFYKLFCFVVVYKLS